jgi:hypothetical protein
VSAEIRYLVAGVTQSCSQLLLQLEPTMIRSDPYAHVLSFLSYSVPAAPWSVSTSA